MWGLATASLLVVGAFIAHSATRAAPAAAPYRTRPLERRNFESVVRASGSLQPVSEILVGSQISGQIVQILVEPNDRVRVGETIARIGDVQIAAHLRGLRAQIVQARAGVAVKQTQVDLAAVQLERSRAAFSDSEWKARNAQLAADLAARQLTRRRALANKGVSSGADLDSAVAGSWQAAAAVSSAQSEVAMARADVSLAEAQLTGAQRDVVSASVAIRIAEAQTGEVEADLRNTEIRAPVAGVILRRTVELGQTVAASFATPTLFTIAEDIGRLRLNLTIDESDVARVRPGERVVFTTPAFPRREFFAEIDTVRIAPRMEQDVVSYTAVANIDNRAGDLLPGMTAMARVVVSSASHALLVPNAALRWAPAGAEAQRDPASVFLLTAEGQLREAKLVLGNTDDRATEVLSGPVGDGDSVVIGTAAPKGGPSIRLQ
jgi:HlyD family secretion protein